MDKSDSTTTAKTAHRQVKSSTTLNRRYVKRPTRSTDVAVIIKKSPKVRRFNSAVSDMASVQTSQSIAKVQPHPIQTVANERMKMRVETTNMATTSGLVSGMTAKQIKDQAIKKALADASQTTTAKEAKKHQKVNHKMHFGWGRVALAFSCAAVAVIAIVYFVNLNVPDISLRVAAMNTGIEASYPSYVPRGYTLIDIASEEGKVTLNFKNSAEDTGFTLVEEKSSWDSNALLNNYVKTEFSEGYTTIREQGLTIYVDGSDATWVNGGVVYKLSANNNVLTKKQIKSIATSL